MRILRNLGFALLLATAATAREDMPKDTQFERPAPGNRTTSKIKMGKRGGAFAYCPSGDCVNGNYVVLKLDRLVEIDSQNRSINVANTMGSDDYTWTTPVTVLQNGINRTSTSLVSRLPISGKNRGSTVGFNFTVDLFGANTSVLNGKNLYDVPGGAMKFTLDLASWPFANNSNRIFFSVGILTRGPNGDQSLGANRSEGVNAHKAKLARLRLNGGTFLDAPTNAVIDGADVNITTATANINQDSLLLCWVFPSFRSTLHYDPVIGDSNTLTTSNPSEFVASGATTSASTTSSDIPSNEAISTTTSSGSSHQVSLAVTMGLAVICTVLSFVS